MIRAEQKLSLRQAAKLAGLAKETLGDLERGKRHPTDVTLSKLADVYGISLQELFDLEEAELVEEEEGVDVGPKAQAPTSQAPPESALTPSSARVPEAATFVEAREYLEPYFQRVASRLESGEASREELYAIHDAFGAFVLFIRIALDAEKDAVGGEVRPESHKLHGAVARVWRALQAAQSAWDERTLNEYADAEAERRRAQMLELSRQLQDVS